MTLNPEIIKDAGGVYWLLYTPDLSADGYAYETPNGPSRTLDPSRGKVKLGKALTAPFAVTVKALDITERAAEHATYPPAAPAAAAKRPPWPHGGIGWWEPGVNVPPGSNRYDMGIVANWQADAHQIIGSTEKLLYTAARCPDSSDYFYGMTVAELVAGGWTAGNIYSSTSPHGLIANLNDPAFAKKWAQNVTAYLLAHGLTGVEIDDIDGKRSELYNGGLPLYPSEQAWQDANIAFLTVAAGYLRAKGFYVLANVSGDDALKLRVAPLVDAVMLESFTVGQLDTARKILAAGCDAVALCYSSPDQVRAAMKSIGDPRALTMFHNGGDPWGPWAA